MRTSSVACLLLLAHAGWAQDEPARPLAQLGTALFRQGEPVIALAFSPDGKYLATVAGSGSAYLWNAHTGQPLSRLAHSPPVQTLAFHKNSQTVVLAGRGGRLSEESVSASGKEEPSKEKVAKPKTAAWSDGPYGVKHLVFASDGTLLSASDNKTITRWDVTTRTALRKFSKHQGYITSLVPAGDEFISAGLDNTVRIWDLETGRGSVLLEDDRQPMRYLALAPGGKTLFSAGPKQPIRIWDIASVKMTGKIDVPDADTGGLALSPDGRLLVAVSTTGKVFVWNVRENRVVDWPLPHLGYHEPFAGEIWNGAIAFSPDGKKLAIGGRELLVVDTTDGAVLPRTNGHWGSVRHVEFAPDDKTLVSAGDDGMLRFWQVPRADAVHAVVVHAVELPKEFDPLLVRFVARDQLLLGSAQGTMMLVDGQKGQKLKTLVNHAGGFKALAVSGSLEQFAAGTEGGEILIYETASGKELRRWKGHPAPLLDLAFLPDHQTLAASDDNGDVRLWDSHTGRQHALLGPSFYLIRNLSAHPAGTLLAGLEMKKPHPPNVGIALPRDLKPPTLVWFDLVREGDKRFVPAARGEGGLFVNRFSMVSFAPDGQAVYAGAAGAISRFDHNAMNTAGTLEEDGFRPGVWRAFAFSHDRKLLAAANSNSTILLWNVADQVKGPVPSPAALFNKDPWDDLAHGNARQAYRAMVRMLEDPKTFVPRLRDRLLAEPKANASLLQHLRAVETLEMMAGAEALGTEAAAALELVARKAPWPQVRAEARRAQQRVDPQKEKRP